MKFKFKSVKENNEQLVEKNASKNKSKARFQSKKKLSEIFWFITLWLAGVLTLGIIGLFIKLMLR